MAGAGDVQSGAYRAYNNNEGIECSNKLIIHLIIVCFRTLPHTSKKLSRVHPIKNYIPFQHPPLMCIPPAVSFDLSQCACTRHGRPVYGMRGLQKRQRSNSLCPLRLSKDTYPRIPLLVVLGRDPTPIQFKTSHISITVMTGI